MMVYGDHVETSSAAVEHDRLCARREALIAMSPGLARHAALVNLHIEAGRLAQGLADRTFDPCVGDRFDGVNARWMAWLLEAAQALIGSWEGAVAATPPPLPDCPSGVVSLKTPEGYAYSGLCPEAYIGPARRLDHRGPGVRVIGLRSIGVSLAPIVAAALQAPAPLTLRPFGPPFDRRVRVETKTMDRLLKEAERFVVVDEGPGLSGSSFAAVARLLMNHGVTMERILFMPGHGGGPGSAATPESQTLWRRIRICPGDSFPEDGTAARWCGELLDHPVRETVDLSAGAWRKLRLPERRWPGVDPRTDRRKLLLRTRSGAFVARFAGLGRCGELKLDRARRLSNAGLVPPLIGMAHGFIIQRWIEAPCIHRVPPEDVAAYLHQRRSLPPLTAKGAEPGALAAMALANVEQGLGATARKRMEPLLQIAGVQADWRSCATDAACQPWKWLWNGRAFMKADALDHDADHDLLGPLDPAWDLASAVTEMGYDAAETQRLLVASAPCGSLAAREALLRFCLVCYPAFRLGASHLAQSRFATGSAEWRRHGKAPARYEEVLLRTIAAGST